MFLHIGGEYIVPLKNLIGIFDMEASTVTKDTKEFLRTAEKGGLLESVTNELPKSFILMKDGKGWKVYFSSISTPTLSKRAFSEGESPVERLKKKG